VEAIEAGYVQREIEESAYRQQREVEAGERVVVGVNRFVDEQAGDAVPVQRIDPGLQQRRVDEVRAFRERRDGAATSAALDAVAQRARTDENLFPAVLHAFRARATLGEIAGVLRNEWGEYR
jgi:methylmalonyl-CoA mutase N-terminal domain/subunit